MVQPYLRMPAYVCDFPIQPVCIVKAFAAMPVCLLLQLHVAWKVLTH